ncbi:phenylalanine--tRNA ligase subunit beta [Gammaproteobacteria bacterium]|nr:phenylalanine--tRNA ligase subunit beta [Gammaproteobacteria bacterium]
MKVAYKHLISCIPSKPSIDEISERFFQLGHEHEVEDEIFDMELTPNRGDCLSVYGLVRDLAPFYEIDLSSDIYEKELKKLDIGFVNHAPEACSHISFLKIDIEGEITSYGGKLKEYFKDLNINKNNFFTDISNYISYEMGQPTHCYDAKKIGNLFSLEIIEKDKKFHTLLEKEIVIKGRNLVFLQDGEVINLAGVMGGKNTSCSTNTKSIIVECAHFNPEEIIGKSVKYDIKSDAAHKFERGVDPLCHEEVLRRFIKIVSDHANIKNIEIYKDTFVDYTPFKIPFDVNKISDILGISNDKKAFKEYLLKLGFEVLDNKIIVPSYRNDIKNLNDIAEEIARVIGYNNIPTTSFKMPPANTVTDIKILEQNVKDFLIKNGFFEVVNNPFVSVEENHTIKVDNPLDSNRQYIRTNLERSLIENLLYNERRQQDSIKLFEISDVYSIDRNLKNKKVLGIICSGRVGKNYLDFSKKINIKYIRNLIKELSPTININPIIVDRKNLNTKLNNEIIYLELELNSLNGLIPDFISNQKRRSKDHNFIKYIPVSEFPSSSRDLSFSIKNIDKYYEIQDYLLGYKSDLIKEVFIFDFYNNQKNDEIKIGFRFIFQSYQATITDKEVNNIMKVIMTHTNSIEGITIPGISKDYFEE